MIAGDQREARAQLSSTIIDYHEPFDQCLTQAEISVKKARIIAGELKIEWEKLFRPLVK